MTTTNLAAVGDARRPIDGQVSFTISPWYRAVIWSKEIEEKAPRAGSISRGWTLGTVSYGHDAFASAKRLESSLLSAP